MIGTHVGRLEWMFSFSLLQENNSLERIQWALSIQICGISCSHFLMQYLILQIIPFLKTPYSLFKYISSRPKNALKNRMNACITSLKNTNEALIPFSSLLSQINTILNYVFFHSHACFYFFLLFFFPYFIFYIIFIGV